MGGRTTLSAFKLPPTADANSTGLILNHVFDLDLKAQSPSLAGIEENERDRKAKQSKIGLTMNMKKN
ncbi:uncharacterized protein PHALS_07688 [Plasmopara halstedii]|uniref:Uncharacterized protein n=1 Tax=Plasmopara halstedii TaxID=4781 RepID=A0A0P1B7U4_PLAHL|nr:uncharacterized protein PHALS_07688 [Plasmopara halstedii]CEG49953.1 hypothetical protein PHALS_07688 [Plasmopara halstedii]|eukprot:XP_024586322.1 hypothetical protein PHALS_07688 [Plasmopara halstedii]